MSEFIKIKKKNKMEKIQTAIQELISELQALKQTKVLMPSLNAIDDCINLAYAKLEAEKIQIQVAYQTSQISMMTADQYYNEKFK